jgi:vancomycin resistance protein YoaR
VIGIAPDDDRTSPFEQYVPEEHRHADVEPRPERPSRSSQRRRATRASAATGGVRGWFAARSGWQKVAIAVPVALIALIGLLGAIEMLASLGRVHPGVSVAGVSVGGMTQARAAAVLDEEISERMNEPVVLEFEGQSWTVTSDDVSASLETTTAVANAMAVGRSGTLGDRLSDRLSAWFDPVELDAVIVGDDERINEVLASVEASVSRPPKDATVVIEGSEARIEPAQVGIGVQREILVGDMLRCLGCEERRVAVPAEFVPVQVTEQDAEEALADALKMMSGPVTVTYEDRSWEFEPDEIAEWIDFRPVPFDETTATAIHSIDCDDSLECTGGVCLDEGGEVKPHRMKLEAFISSDLASKTVTARVGEAGSPAQNASFKAGGGRVEIIPHRDGTGPDVAALATSMTSVLLGEEERVVALRTTRVSPDITTEDAREMGIKERISTYSTTFSSGNKPRVNNIHVLADALDGTLIPPGATFSFNGSVGPRTADKGYQSANAIVNGELVPQLGGGICQIGTTLFNTVFESGLPVVERKNHSFYISSYPKGRDATVSWGGPDFKFRNDTDTWVLIATGYSNSSVTISLYGTDPGYDVTADVGSWSNIKSHPVKEVDDNTLPEGSRVTEDAGVDGRTITVKRVVKKDGTVVREDTFRSAEKVELVGENRELQDLVNIWEVAKTRQQPSAIYVARHVLIDSDVELSEGQPVQTRVLATGDLVPT